MQASLDSAHSKTSNPHNSLDNDVLNELLAVLVDSKDFFEQAEKLAKSEEINLFFKNNAAQREERKEFIKNLIISRGGIPVDTGTLTGELRKLYTEFMVLLNDDSLNLLEQMTYHEIRNLELLELLIDSAQTTFIASIVEESRKAISSTIKQMQQSLAIHE